MIHAQLMKCIIVKFHLVGRSLSNEPTGTRVASGYSDLPRWNRTLTSTTAKISVNPDISRQNGCCEKGRYWNDYRCLNLKAHND